MTTLPCGQCGKQAVIAVGDASLCVDCHYKLSVARTLEVRMQVMHLNYASELMDHMTGLPPASPKMQVPEIPKGPIILNNIKIDNSVVGAINTGTVQSIDVHLSYLKTGGNKALSDAPQALTESIANAPALSPEEKSPMLDQVSYLTEQAALAAKDRKPGMIQAALAALSQGASAITAAAAAWTVVAPLLRAHFGL